VVADKRKGIIAVLVVVILVVSGAVVLVAVNNQQGSGGAGQITDALGRSINITNTPRTIISMAPSITEMVYCLGAGDRLIGVTTYCDYPDNVTSRVENGTLSTVGGFYTPDAQKIIVLNPDIVLMDSSVKAQKDALPLLLGRNLTVVALYKGTNITEVYSNIELAGKVLGEQQKATQLINEMSAEKSSLISMVKNQTVHPSVLFAVGFSPLYVVGSGTYIDDMINVSGGVNTFGDQNGWPSPSMEQVVMRAPDVLIVSAGMMQNDPQTLISQLQNDSSWAMTPAVQNGQIYIVYGQTENCFFRQGVRMVDGMQLLAEILYPQLFGVQLPHVMGDGYEQYITP